ncbi:pyridoxamine 5'-phosphate oxidase [Micromonospora sp. RHAY321]|uniref:pyridoxamine 5'-phosphate oxidase n=1 Tax=Micromonospora sp. RHAY321 TaxID=2944807 RepID=UPI00207CBF8B|nr:pyridoxamine 5'-phosphate oxidase [Micromonospora sp. RHAY321]MCO1595451.1 pyridoxamine 5'-phosphate oxidase [Micromonospora sp. RHAY321]
MRNEYAADLGLTEADLAADWHTQFDRWFADAVAFGLPEPNAMVVGTADAAGRPSGRTVLLKGYDPEGFVFFTNHLSRKGVEASANPYASLVFPWFPMQRQVVVSGRIAPVDRATSESYFASRPRGSQLGAWASPQSQVVPDRAALEESYRAAAERFDGEPVIPTPPNWGGLRVRPESVEFWQGRASRLHDRLRFRRTADDGPGGAPTGSASWVVERLAP